jgi:hypothetical protein
MTDSELEAKIKAAVFEHTHTVDEEGDQLEIGNVGTVGGLEIDDTNLLHDVRQAFTDAGWSKPNVG